MAEVKVYSTRANAVRRMKTFAETYPKATWDVQETDEGFIVVAKGGKGIAKELADEPVSVIVETAADKAAAKAVAREEVLAERAKAKQEKADKLAADKAAKKAAKAPAANGDNSLAAMAERTSARIGEGKPPFREGKKRDLVYKLLLKGVTAEQGEVTTGWNKSVVVSEFWTIARLVGKKLNLNKSTATYTLS